MDKLRSHIAECEKQLENGVPDPDTIYVFRKEDISLDEINERFKGVCYLLTDKEIIVTPSKDR
jgi:hypothetical protein